jgi:hypothetical protein
MKRLALTVLFLTAAIPLQAWTRLADRRIASHSAELAPPDLRLLIKQFRQDYARGLDEALADEGSEIHRGKLRSRIESETSGIVRMIRTNAPMSSVVERLGILVHLIGDANNPFHVGPDDPVSHEDFEGYFERGLPRFAIYFYGIDRHFALKPYLDRTFARTAKFSPLMTEEYFRGGDRRSSEDFDDRSTAFGVAALCYSHAITDAANVYYFIWKEAGGDVRGLPRSVVLNAN